MTAPFDFDTPPDRRGSDSTKWAKYAGRDVVPMWVADMDFAAPPVVVAALRARVEHAVYGYCNAPASLVDAVIAALWRDYAWRIEPQWLVWLPGLVTGLNAVCRAAGEAGDEVVIGTPIYPPFLSAPELTQRTRVCIPLRRVGSRWNWDIERTEVALTDRARLLMLCNPHNPVGCVYDEQELRQLAQLAERHDLVICADEIHAGLILTPGRRHIPIATLDETTANRTITLMAPSKTYNIPGLGCAYAVVSNPALRRKLVQAMRGIVPDVNVFGYAAAEAAYRHGEPWRLALIDYLRENARIVQAAIEEMRGLSSTPVEATYLAWIDARGLGVDDPYAVFEAAGVGLSDGTDFGAPGYLRLNFGCARATLLTALDRMRAAVPEALSSSE